MPEHALAGLPYEGPVLIQYCIPGYRCSADVAYVVTPFDVISANWMLLQGMA